MELSRKNWTARLPTGLASALVSVVLASPWTGTARADDIEVFFGERPSQVNILFVFDTSATMWTVESGSADSLYADHRGSWRDQLPPGTQVCDTTRVFFRESGSGWPSCGANTPGIDNAGYARNHLSCEVPIANGDLETQLAASDGVLLTPLRFSVSQYVNGAWRKPDSISNADLPTLCRIGNTVASPLPHDSSGTPAANRFLTFSGELITGDRLNWETYKSLQTSTRISLAKDAAKTAINALPLETRVGMMRFSGADSLDQSCNLAYYTGDAYQQYLRGLGGGDGTGQAGGGMIVAPVMGLEDTYPPDTPPYLNASGSIQRSPDDRAYAGVEQRTKLNDILTDDLYVFGQGGSCSVPLLTPNGRTPIAETLLEIRRYFKSLDVVYGVSSNVASFQPWSSDAVSMRRGGAAIGSYPLTQSDLSSGATYVSPITESCNPITAIVLLSDGGTQQDSPAIDGNGPESYEALARAVRAANPDLDIPLTCDDDGLGTAGSPSRCVDDLAELLYREMGVNTYTILYKIQNENQRQMLQDAATRSDGDYKVVENSADLLPAFTDTFNTILTRSASFSSPTVAVNAFNRLQNAEQVFVSLFEPGDKYRWNGNAKRYKLASTGDILDRTDAPAVDGNTGFFAENARSFWSPPTGCPAPNSQFEPDGAEVPLGGAANNMRCTPPTDRRVFRESFGSTDNLAALCASGATLPTATELGLAAPNDQQADRDAMVAFLCDHRDDPLTESPMGDPLHSRPVLYQYLTSSADVPPEFRSILFVTTNDGFLHAINTDNGNELWSIVPSDMLRRTADLARNAVLPINPNDGLTPIRTYGLDGNLRLFRHTKGEPDSNGNYPAYLFFGERRGGGNYFGIDVSDPLNPVLMWKLDGAASGISQSWSTPAPTYVLDPENFNQPRPVLIFGGGYDENHEILTGDLLDDAADSAKILMVDAFTGQVLWQTSQVDYPDMRYAFPAEIRVIDLIGADDVADRLYASDMGGQLWRFDFDYRGATTGVAPTSIDEVVVGGRIASLGGAEATGDPAARRRFFYPPDAAIIRQGASTWINLAIGSGHREFPRYDQTTQDRLYSVRDNVPFAPRAASTYTDAAVVTPDDLQRFVIVDGSVVADPALSADQLNKGWYLQLETGEKVLSETRTFANQTFAVTTKSQYLTGVCPGYSLRNRLYVLDPRTAQATNNLDNQAGNDPYVDLELSDSISPEPVFLFPPDAGAVDPGTGFAGRSAPTCLVGLERCPAGLFNPPTRTFWKQRGLQ